MKKCILDIAVSLSCSARSISSPSLHYHGEHASSPEPFVRAQSSFLFHSESPAPRIDQPFPEPGVPRAAWVPLPSITGLQVWCLLDAHSAWPCVKTNHNNSLTFTTDVKFGVSLLSPCLQSVSTLLALHPETQLTFLYGCLGIEKNHIHACVFVLLLTKAPFPWRPLWVFRLVFAHFLGLTYPDFWQFIHSNSLCLPIHNRSSQIPLTSGHMRNPLQQVSTVQFGPWRKP